MDTCDERGRFPLSVFPARFGCWRGAGGAGDGEMGRWGGYAPDLRSVLYYIRVKCEIEYTGGLRMIWGDSVFPHKI
jgi:hypothetical protein